MLKQLHLLLLDNLGRILDLLIVRDDLLVCGQLEVTAVKVGVGVVVDSYAWHICGLPCEIVVKWVEGEVVYRAKVVDVIDATVWDARGCEVVRRDETM